MTNEKEYGKLQKLLLRYQRCANKIWELFPKDPLPDGHPAQGALERLEAIVELGLLQSKPPADFCPTYEPKKYESLVPDWLMTNQTVLCKTCDARFNPTLEELKCPHRCKSEDAVRVKISDPGDSMSLRGDPDSEKVEVKARGTLVKAHDKTTDGDTINQEAIDKAVKAHDEGYKIGRHSVLAELEHFIAETDEQDGKCPHSQRVTIQQLRDTVDSMPEEPRTIREIKERDELIAKADAATKGLGGKPLGENEAKLLLRIQELELRVQGQGVCHKDAALAQAALEEKVKQHFKTLVATEDQLIAKMEVLWEKLETMERAVRANSGKVDTHSRRLHQLEGWRETFKGKSLVCHEVDED
jgi:hypothetical protein